MARRARLNAAVDGAAVLRHSSVSPATLANYKSAVQQFKEFAARRRWSTAPDFVSESLQRYFWHYADRGFDAALGRHTLYGWLHLECPSKSVAANSLENVREAVAGWRKIHGENSRDPIPEEVHLALVRQLIQLDKLLAAAALFLHPQLYLRPSELMALRAEDILVPPAGAARYRSTGVIIAPRELEMTTKTKAQDDTVLIDCACQPACSGILAELARIRSSGGRLFPQLGLNSYEKLLRDTARIVGIGDLGVVPHTMRHTGPANDIYHDRRSLQAVAKRGRWANIKSVQRYSKSGRLLKVWRSVSAQQRAEWTRAAPGTGGRLLSALRRLPQGYRGS